MRNAQGMIRSKEMMSSKKPVIAHIEVHPMMGGGVHVHHIHTEPMVHPPKVHKFGPEQGTAFHDHMEQHTGMSWEPAEGDAEPNVGAENEVQGGDNAEA